MLLFRDHITQFHYYFSSALIGAKLLFFFIHESNPNLMHHNHHYLLAILKTLFASIITHSLILSVEEKANSLNRFREFDELKNSQGMNPQTHPNWMEFYRR
jgi:hypothetical protein